MIKSLQIHQYKNHRDSRIEFGRLTVLAGPNGVGKTNLLKAILSFGADNWEFDGNRKIGTPTPPQKEVIIQGYDELSPWTAYSDKKLSSSARWIRENYEIEDDVRDSFNLERYVPEPDHYGWYYFKPDVEKLAAIHYSENPNPRLSSDGSGLASVIAHQMTASPDNFSRMMTHLREVIPIVDRIRATRGQTVLLESQTAKIKSQEISYNEPRVVIGDALLFDMKGVEGIDAHSVSDGTLITLAILTLLHQKQVPELILIDDIEQGLHPAAQQALIRQIRQILDSNPDLQIVVTTHSPYVLDECDPKEVWLMAPDEEGFTHIQQLSKHPSADRALKALTVGEFWSAEGEDWVVEHSSKGNGG